MSKATAQDIAAMDAAQRETERVLQVAESRASNLELLPAILRTDLQEGSMAAIRNGRLQFNQWVDGQRGLRRFALDGRTTDGRPYEVVEWLAFGRELGSRMAAEAGTGLSAGLFLYTPAAVLRPVVNAAAGAGVRAETAVRSVAQAAEEFLENPKLPSVPTSLKVAAWALGGTLVVGVLAYGLSQVNALAALLPTKKDKE